LKKVGTKIRERAFERDTKVHYNKGGIVSKTSFEKIIHI
tara:strand:- start:106 stop:222 length:117 start_codon:yes stop_codon:yes gene_type:complete